MNEQRHGRPRVPRRAQDTQHGGRLRTAPPSRQRCPGASMVSLELCILLVRPNLRRPSRLVLRLTRAQAAPPPENQRRRHMDLCHRPPPHPRPASSPPDPASGARSRPPLRQVAA